MRVRARWYDPNLGRFISEDPVGFTGGSNWFGYVGNNPANLYDPYGLLPNSKYSERCKAWLDTIANLSLKIAERIGEMHENPQNLPWRAPNDTQKPSLSRWGHRGLIEKDKARRAMYEALVKAYCDDEMMTIKTKPQRNHVRRR